MIARALSPGWFRALFTMFFVVGFSAVAACGGGDGGGDLCLTCPPPPDTIPPPPPPPMDGTVSVTIQYDAAATSALLPAGFKVVDIEEVELVIAGVDANVQETLTPQQTTFTATLPPGSYAIAASAQGADDLVLFTSSTNADVVAGETTEAILAMVVAMGDVILEVDGRTSGVVDAVASFGVPFSVTVRNTQGDLVPNSIVDLQATDPDFASVTFDDTNRTDANGAVSGTIDARVRGSTGLTLSVDDRSIPSAGQVSIDFATGVDAARSEATANGSLIVADGVSQATITVSLRNSAGEELPRVPVMMTADRNANDASEVIDLLNPAPGFESGTTDEGGSFMFNVRSRTSSLLIVDEEGNLRSEGSGQLFPSQVRISAEGIDLGMQEFTIYSNVDPFSGSFTSNRLTVDADGSDFARLTVSAVDEEGGSGGGPAEGRFVEFRNFTGETLNYTMDIAPEPGFENFRTDENGEWRGRIRSTEVRDLLLLLFVDGRQLRVNAVPLFFR